MISDLKFALRSLRYTPGFTLVAVLIVAIGDKAPLTSASSVIRPWQVGHESTSTASVRARSSAHGRYPPA